MSSSVSAANQSSSSSSLSSSAYLSSSLLSSSGSSAVSSSALIFSSSFSSPVISYPVITGLSPNHSSLVGATTSVFVYGMNFTAFASALNVTFTVSGDTSASSRRCYNVSVVDDNTLTCAVNNTDLTSGTTVVFSVETASNLTLNSTSALTMTVDWCMSSPCGQYGVCETNSSRCICLDNFIGARCQTQLAPLVTSVAPSNGPLSYPTMITIGGQYFGAANQALLQLTTPQTATVMYSSLNNAARTCDALSFINTTTALCSINGASSGPLNSSQPVAFVVRVGNASSSLSAATFTAHWCDLSLCVHGDCNDAERTCSCDPAWNGTLCDQRIPSYISSVVPSTARIDNGVTTVVTINGAFFGSQNDSLNGGIVTAFLSANASLSTAVVCDAATYVSNMSVVCIINNSSRLQSGVAVDFVIAVNSVVGPVSVASYMPDWCSVVYSWPSLSQAPPQCVNGDCVTLTSSCACWPGWEGLDCSQLIPPIIYGVSPRTTPLQFPTALTLSGAYFGNRTAFHRVVFGPNGNDYDCDAVTFISNSSLSCSITNTAHLRTIVPVYLQVTVNALVSNISAESYEADWCTAQPPPCGNNGICNSNAESVLCTCAYGWIGFYCNVLASPIIYSLQPALTNTKLPIVVTISGDYFISVSDMANGNSASTAVTFGPNGGNTAAHTCDTLNVNSRSLITCTIISPNSIASGIQDRFVVSAASLSSNASAASSFLPDWCYATPSPCVHGVCNSLWSNCTCYRGFSGDSCATVIPSAIYSVSPLTGPLLPSLIMITGLYFGSSLDTRNVSYGPSGVEYQCDSVVWMSSRDGAVCSINSIQHLTSTAPTVFTVTVDGVSGSVSSQTFTPDYCITADGSPQCGSTGHCNSQLAHCQCLYGFNNTHCQDVAFPTVSSITPTTSSIQYPMTVTLNGLYFGTAQSSIDVLYGIAGGGTQYTCGAVAYLLWSIITCTFADSASSHLSYGQSYDFQVNVDGVFGVRSSSVLSLQPSYHAPPTWSPSTINPVSFNESGGENVTITGVDLWRVSDVWIMNTSVPFQAYGGPTTQDQTPPEWMNETSGFHVMSSGSEQAAPLPQRWSLLELNRQLCNEDAEEYEENTDLHVFSVMQTTSAPPPLPVPSGFVFGGIDNSLLIFVSPPSNVSGFVPLTIRYVNSDDPRVPAATSTWIGTDWIYYSLIICDSGFISNYQCLPCPPGAFCPGGGRAWPIAGYWSFSENSVPVACAIPSACPGAVVDPVTLSTGERLTSVCAEGYTGTYCSSCTANYYSDGLSCQTCGLTSDDRIELAAIIVVALLLFIAMSVAVATASSDGLSAAVAGILMMQRIAVVGGEAGKQLPSSMSVVTQLFTALSIFDFNITVVKPGCVVAAMSFLTVYWATFLMVCVTSVLFTIASYVRAQRASLKERKHSRMWIFGARLLHSHLILGSIVFLRMTTYNLEAVDCAYLPLSDGTEQYVLLVDLVTPCYVGNHLYSAFFIWPFLIFYSVGFPFVCFYLLRTSVAKRNLSQLQQLHADQHRSSHSPAPSSKQISDEASLPGSTLTKLPPPLPMLPSLAEGEDNEEGVHNEHDLLIDDGGSKRSVSLFSEGIPLDKLNATKLSVSSKPSVSFNRGVRASIVGMAQAAAKFRPRHSSLSGSITQHVYNVDRQHVHGYNDNDGRNELYGYLYRRLTEDFYFFECILLAVEFVFACVTVLPTSALLRLFLTAVCSLTQFLLIAGILPYHHSHHNYMHMMFAVGETLQIAALLYLVDVGEDSSSTTSSTSSVDLGHGTQSQSATQVAAALAAQTSEAHTYDLYLLLMGIAAVCIVIYVNYYQVIHQLIIDIIYGTRLIILQLIHYVIDPIIFAITSVRRRSSTAIVWLTTRPAYVEQAVAKDDTSSKRPSKLISVWQMSHSEPSEQQQTEPASVSLERTISAVSTVSPTHEQQQVFEYEAAQLEMMELDEQIHVVPLPPLAQFTPSSKANPIVIPQQQAVAATSIVPDDVIMLRPSIRRNKRRSIVETILTFGRQSVRRSVEESERVPLQTNGHIRHSSSSISETELTNRQSVIMPYLPLSVPDVPLPDIHPPPMPSPQFQMKRRSILDVFTRATSVTAPQTQPHAKRRSIVDVFGRTTSVMKPQPTQPHSRRRSILDVFTSAGSIIQPKKPTPAPPVPNAAALDHAPRILAQPSRRRSIVDLILSLKGGTSSSTSNPIASSNSSIALSTFSPTNKYKLSSDPPVSRTQSSVLIRRTPSMNPPSILREMPRQRATTTTYTPSLGIPDSTNEN